jgi:ferritin
MDFEEMEEIIDSIGASAHYQNVLAEISNLISAIDSNLDEETADEVIQCLREQISEVL